MLRALLERGIRPDLILGTSVGAVNGVAIAAEPTVPTVDALEDMWSRTDETGVFGGSLLARLSTLARTRTHLHDAAGLRRALEAWLPVDEIEALVVPFQCVAASIERASEHWFTSGPIIDAVLASSAVPGLLPPVGLNGEHFLDGGLVNSIPVGRAVALGATELYVLQVGRVDRPLEAPRWPWEVGLVAFEIARRHRFAGDIAALPDGVRAHVMPTGQREPPNYRSFSQRRSADPASLGEGIALAHAASKRYLEQAGVGSSP
ncbi:MAG: patatin-like phospholipase family protein [Thermoleophilaceae bacterium]|nr:patatin-like phospholipase family protein [Thermoleophilaceae bacterium]